MIGKVLELLFILNFYGFGFWKLVISIGKGMKSLESDLYRERFVW